MSSSTVSPVESTAREQATSGVLVLDRESRLLSASDSSLALLGLTPESLGTVPSGRARQRLDALLEPLPPTRGAGLGAGKGLARVPSGARGAARPLEVSWYSIRGEDSATDPLALHWQVDSSAKAPTERPDLYQAFFDSGTPVEVTDAKGVILDVNEAFLRMLGYTRDELIGRHIREIRSPRNPRATLDAIERDVVNPHVGRWTGELLELNGQGEEIPVLLSMTIRRDEQGVPTHRVGVLVDLREQKVLQLQAIRAERLASLGGLAAGVAHELNTPLANILLIAESIERRAPNPWVAGRASAIGRQIDAAAKIVAGLLDFGRQHAPVLREADMVAVVQEAIEFVRGKQGPDVEVVEVHTDRPLLVRVNRVQLVQVLVNLFNNAYDAMEGRGTLTVTSRRQDGHVEVAIEDSGTGIPPTVMPHIFEPFYTSKVEGKGAGLGLSICHGILRSHGGSIRVDSELGKGATFTIRLPAYEPTTS